MMRLLLLLLASSDRQGLVSVSRTPGLLRKERIPVSDAHSLDPPTVYHELFFS